MPKDKPDTVPLNAPEPADEILRAVLKQHPVRIVATLTTAATRVAVGRHRAGRAGALALGRGLTAGLLLATLTKDDERVTLQVLGDGPLGSVTVDASAAGTVRAYVKNPAVPLPAAPAGARRSLADVVGRTGVISVVRDLGLRENFSGQTAISTGEIDEDVERYLLDSEQIASALVCDALVSPDGTIACAGGILIQALPGSDGAAIVAAARAELHDGGLLRILQQSPANAARLIEAALGDQFGVVEVLDRRPVRFDCPCSRARAAGSLALLGDAELSAMILEDGQAEVTCNFCRARYQFDDAALETIRRDLTKPVTPPS